MGSRILGLLLRYGYLYRRSLARAMELFFWPVMDLLVWGFLSAYLQKVAAPRAVSYLVGALILWDILYRCQQAITLAVTEDIWVKNILNVFIAPVRPAELAIATSIVGVLKAAIPGALLTVLALLLYDFNLLALGASLAPFLASLMLFGWAVGLFTAALILRFGQAAEALVWGVPFVLQPFSAVFYPVDALPAWARAVALTLPSTHVFEGMRAVVAGEGVRGATLAAAFGLNALYLGAGAVFFGWMLKRVREKGYLGKLGME